MIRDRRFIKGDRPFFAGVGNQAIKITQTASTKKDGSQGERPIRQCIAVNLCREVTNMGRFFNEVSDVGVWFLFRNNEECKWIADYVRLNPLRFGGDVTCQKVKCRRCGKVLKSLESIALGIGPVCPLEGTA